MINNNILRDIRIAQEEIIKSDISIVVIKNGDILAKKNGEGLKPLLEIINELGTNINNSIIGDKILGKASALLCVYAKVKGVYSPQSTIKAIAILLKNNIASQIDQIVPFIKNKIGDDICPFEKMIKNIETPDKAYKTLKKNIMK